MNAPILTFFNNKGGVGKTSTLYNLSYMFSKLGKRVLAVDLDPQANLTSMCLDDDILWELWDEKSKVSNKQTIYHAIQPLMEGVGDIQLINPQSLINAIDYFLIPGDLRLSEFEDQLAREWNSVLGGKVLGINITSAFGRLIRQMATKYEIDIVFVDVGPNLGAINRAALIASDYVVIPLVPDLFSLQGLKNVGKYLREWRQDWQQALEKIQKTASYPTGQMQPVGYVMLQHRERQARPIVAHQNWISRIPKTYSESILGKNGDAVVIPDPNQIGLVRNYQSMMAMSHESRKPVFDLKSADGAIGSHIRVVKESEDTYRELAKVIAERIGMLFDDE